MDRRGRPDPADPADGPMFDTLAFVKRRGQVLSPATRELVRMAWDSLVSYQASAGGSTGTRYSLANSASVESQLDSLINPERRKTSAT